jgi:transposase, IS5 family
MRPKHRRESGQHDLLRPRLDQLTDPQHALTKLGRQINWGFLESKLGAAYTDRQAGRRCRPG